MAKTLSASEMKLEQDLKKAFKDAAYDAYMSQFKSNSIPEAQKYDNDTKNAMEKQAKDYAKAFSETLAGDMAKAIHDFVKEIGIQINTIPPSVIAPSGPVTGMIPMTSFTIL